MKKLLQLLLTLSFLMIANGVMAQNIDYRKLDSPLPNIKLVDRAGISYTSIDITEDRNFFLILFNPQCGHCVDVGKIFRNNKILFDDNTVMFMAAAEMMNFLPSFAGEVDWVDGANMILGVDSAGVVADLYNYIAVPQINIYNAEMKLIKVFNGEVKLEDLQPYIR